MGVIIRIWVWLTFSLRKGYDVFAYDATGNDESEGNSVKGVPQFLIDLDYAIQFVKQTPDFDGSPIVLFGHSLGGILLEVY